jgi:glycosyltransferase involved in cell wall biosynthesis
VPTSALKKQLHKRLFIPKNKVSVIPNFSHNKKGGNNTMLKNNTVLSVGRLVPEKNHQLLLEASKRFADFSHQTHVQILGDGALRPLLEDEIKKYNLEKHVFLLGYSDDTYRHYYNANCFVSTSLSEGFPNVFLEAMSAGLPIVCLDTNFGPREILLKPLHPHKKNIDPIIDVYQHEKFSIINPSVSELESKLALEIIRLQILNKGSSINWSKHLDYFSEKSILPQWETLLI